MTPDELTVRTRPWREARDLEVSLRPGRDAAMLQALAESMTERAVAVAVGVSAGLPNHVKKTSARELTTCVRCGSDVDVRSNHALSCPNPKEHASVR